MDMLPDFVKVVLVFIVVTITGSDGEGGPCKLRKDDLCDVMQCNDWRGRLYISTSQAMEGSTCFFRCANETFTTWKRCQDGKWKIYKRNGKDISLEKRVAVRRVKRGFWSAIGNFFKCIFTLGFLCGGRDRDTVPPSLHCPSDKWTLSDDLQDSATVHWTEPTARDDRDGHVRVHRNGRGPGLPFSEGTTVIGYYARDKSGNMARCSFRIVVEVPRCENLPSLADGYYMCHPSSDMVKGTVCRFGCYNGHRLVGDRSTRCTEYGTWTNNIPKCERRKCEPPLTGTGETTVQCSDQNFYRSKCSYTCADGFDVKPGMTRVRVCTKDGMWRGNEPKCTDVTRPVITNCTRAVYGFADRGSTSGSLHWAEPSVYDNADKTIRLHRTGPSSDERLEAGTYDVTYTAVDKSGNEAVPCRMKVVVKMLRCPPIHSLPHQTVDCPDGYKYGSQCYFKCANGSLINGTEVASCERESTGQYVSWRWGDYQPFCNVVQLCEDDLRPPDNGALACDNWFGGKFCQMLCKKGYDIPPGYIHSDMYVCGESGQWLPGPDLPNCAKSFSSHTSALRMGVNYYFDGDCNDADVIEDIKVKFINALKTSLFKDACEVYAEKCYPGNVQVQCGYKSGKRSTNLNIQFDMEITVRSPFGNKTFGKLNQNITSLMVNVDNGTFKIPDLPDGSVITVQDFHFDRLRIICDGNLVPSYVSESCVECPVGTYYDKDTKSCLMCAIGEYRPSTDSASCIKCPNSQTTRREGATSIDECEDACPLGTFSKDGLPPCTPCPVGTYTDGYGSETCMACPVSSTTLTEGTYRQRDCKDFDLVISNSSGKVVLPINSATINRELNFTLGFRMKLQQTPIGSVIRLNFPNISEYVDISFVKGMVIITVNSVHITSNVSLGNTLWHSLVLGVEESEVQLYIDGYRSALQYNTRIRNHEEKLPGPNIVIADGNVIGSLAHLNIWSQDNSLDDILSIVSRCDHTRQGDLLGWKEFENVDREDVFIQIPSVCDDHDNCDVSTCNGGQCIDGLHSHTCVCPIGLKGDNCEINTDDCGDNSCENNSTCVDGIGGYTCQCGINCKGDLCEIEIVDGNWSVWSNWSECSSTCGNGTSTRKRLCNNPTPDHGGKDCFGEDFETVFCNMENCPVCKKLTAPDNSILDCIWNTTEEAINCTLSCNHGYNFDHAAKTVFQCGPDTFYLWDFQTDDNPYGRLPACTKIAEGSKIDWTYRTSYEDLTCNEDNFELVTKKIKTVVYEATQSITCQQDESCTLVNIDVTECLANRRRRSTNIETAGFSSDFTCDATRFTSDGCKDIVIGSLEDIIIKIRDNAFNTIVDDVEYPIKQNSSAFGGSVTCDPGTVPVRHYCVPCSTGRYQHGDSCEKCSEGTFQSNVGQTSCVSCPDGFTTEGRASTTKADCNVSVNIPPDHRVPVWQIAVPIAIMVFGIVGVSCITFRKMKRQKSSHIVSRLETKTDNSKLPDESEHELEDLIDQKQ
ncbi:uncharacterized protein LOC117317375 [Pecten maximus]|uniref:uncharacterized protein LOC117317375 n=1 Tax=Pecten maximus TaxID=6579 RepID=UPI0014582189|nr:uncharacterized protein LOC117317375 [Pecten maximus]